MSAGSVSSVGRGSVGAYESYEFVTDDLFNSVEDVMGHQTNCKTTKPWGLSKAMFDRYPVADVYSDDSVRVPGTTILRKLESGRYVANLMGQRYPSRPKYKNDTSEKRLQWFTTALEEIPDELSVALPYRIGCGLAGGDWDDYEDVIHQWSKHRAGVVTIYQLE
jgi:hypothetical protein